MAEELYPVPDDWARTARIDAASYERDYARSLDDSTRYWLDQAARLEWTAFPTVADESDFRAETFAVRWFADGMLNVSANFLDRHLATRGEQVAIIWEPDDPAAEARRITYRELHGEVCRFANVLKGKGVRKGDRVTLYLPMIPEAAVAMLACTRIGAIHSIVFGGFSPEALAGRIADCDSRVVITADEGCRGGKKVALKTNVDAAAKFTTCLDTVIVVKATGGDIPMTMGRDHWYGDLLAQASTRCLVPALHGAGLA